MKLMGAKEIQRVLDNLTNKEVAKAARTACREAQKVIMLPEYKGKARAMVGGRMGSQIAAALKVRAMKVMRQGHYGVKILLDEPEEFVYHTADGKRYFIPSAIEYGHAFPGRGGGRNAPKHVAANPFARTAFENKKYQTHERAARLLWAKLEREIRKNEVKPR